MSETPSSSGGNGGGAPAWMTAILGLSTFLSLGFWLVMAAGEADVDVIESPLILSVARQLMAGPGGLYGPFGGENPWVLIHAPVYYRLAALLAWPLNTAGLGAATAATLAGRVLSLLGLAAAMLAAYRLARLDGAKPVSGWWAVLLFAAIPEFSGHAIAVRPDLLGVAIQTIGVLYVLTALGEDRHRARRLTVAYAAFGLAACVKQHFVLAAILSTIMLITTRRIPVALIARSALLAVVVVAGVYGLEGLVTRGNVWTAAFLVPASIGQHHPGGWFRLQGVLFLVLFRCIGLVALLLAAAVTTIASRPGLARRAAEVAGYALLAFVFLNMAVLLFSRGDSVPVLLAGLTGVALLPVFSSLAGPHLAGGRVDTALWFLCLGELTVTALLSRGSSGAWSNYAIQSVVFACVVTARALARACEGTPGVRQKLALAVAAGTVLAASLLGVSEDLRRRLVERAEVDQIVSRIHRPRAEFFFMDSPGLNRTGGRLDLVYDEWLYPVFESLGLAEPRSLWIPRALRSPPATVVVTTSESPGIGAQGPTLGALGYHRAFEVGRFYVWER
jgi:hypothetical protein